MRLMVTGATGFIGSHLCLHAQAVGHQVLATGLENTQAEAANAKSLRDAGIAVRLCDLQSLAADEGAFAGVEAVLHLAAAQHEVSVPDQHFHSVNVAGTWAVLAASARAGVRRFVHGSTIGVYGHREGELDEATPPEPDNVYGATKLEAEREVLTQGAGPERVVMRISETYGPGDRRLLKLFRAIQSKRFCNVGGGRNLHHPIFVDDLARGLLLGATHPAAAGQLFVLAGKEIVSTDEMVAAIADAVGAEPPALRLPLWPFIAAATLLEAACRPLGISPPLHRRRMDFFRKSFRLDGSKAARELGFTPKIGFAEGARLAAAWYRAQGVLGPAGQAPSRTSNPVSVMIPTRWLAKTIAATGRSSTP